MILVKIKSQRKLIEIWNPNFVKLWSGQKWDCKQQIACLKERFGSVILSDQIHESFKISSPFARRPEKNPNSEDSRWPDLGLANSDRSPAIFAHSPYPVWAASFRRGPKKRSWLLVRWGSCCAIWFWTRIWVTPNGKSTRRFTTYCSCLIIQAVIEVVAKSFSSLIRLLVSTTTLFVLMLLQRKSCVNQMNRWTNSTKMPMADSRFTPKLVTAERNRFDVWICRRRRSSAGRIRRLSSLMK